MMKRFFRPGWLLVAAVAGVIMWLWLGKIDLKFDHGLVVEEGDTLASILEDQGWLDSRRVRRLAASYNFDPAALAVGSYPSLSGSVSVTEFYEALRHGPSSVYERVTILEGWSIYDTDALLADAGRIRPGDYIAYVTDPAIIGEVSVPYPFLEVLPTGEKSLEGFLYPDTYFIDLDDPLLPQLVKLQLDGFQDNIWLPYGNRILDDSIRESQGLNAYELLTMASIVLKEERNTQYQSLVAGVFLNRLKSDMRLDADITLCYGLQEPYESCPPSVIVQHLNDGSNPYNTRAVKGLPPTPISSLTPDVVRAVLDVEIHDFLYYLHDSDGAIHPARTNGDHLDNKKRYLQ